jgi:MFS family permease
MSNPSGNSQASRRFGSALVLLAGCVLINYVDRGNLSLAAPLVQKEFGLSATQLGVVLGAFFWSYTFMQFVAGWLVDRFEVNFVIAAGFSLWSLATAATAFAPGFFILLFMRLLLGVGESVAFPSTSKLLAYHVPEHQRGFANGILMSAIRLGPAIGTFAAGPLIARHGWRPVFVGIGLISLLWLPAWFHWMPARKHAPRSQSAGPDTSAILRQRSFWGASVGHFSVNYLFYFMLTWLPYYLVHARGLSIEAMVKAAGLYYLTDASSAAATGWVADFWMRHGGPTTLVRKSFMGAGCVISIAATAGCALAGPERYFAWLLGAGVGCGMMGVGVFAYSQTLAGPQAAGKWTGLQNGFGNFAGVIGPALTGFVVDKSGSFLAPFAITVAVLIIGAIAWVYVVGPLEQVNWTARDRPIAPVLGAV